VYEAISRLAPQNEAERALKTQAANLMVQLAELRSLLQAQAVSSVSKPLLIALVLWLVVIFFGFSLLAPANATSTLALIAGAFSVVCAVFIILELDYPFAGIVRIPSDRSEERRVGKECRARWWRYHEKKKGTENKFGWRRERVDK